MPQPSPVASRPLPAKPLVVLFVLLVILADYSTGYDLSFIAFYIIPIALATWYVSFHWGLAVALISSVAITYVEAMSRSYPATWYLVANTGLRLCPFVLFVFLVAKVREGRDEQNRLNAELQKTIADLELSLETVRQLQGKIQLVCSWTHRIQSEGRWMSFEEFMSRNLHLKFTHGISEEGVTKFRQELGL